MSFFAGLFGRRKRTMVALEDVENILFDRIATIEGKKALASQRIITILIDGNQPGAAAMSRDVFGYEQQLAVLNEVLADLELTHG